MIEVNEELERLKDAINGRLQASFDEVNTYREFKAMKDGWEFTTIVKKAGRKTRMDAFIEHDALGPGALNKILFGYIVDLVSQ